MEKQFAQKTDEYEKRIEVLIAKTHEQLKSIEGLLIDSLSSIGVDSLSL